MSTCISLENSFLPHVITARRTESLDAPYIIKLLEKSTQELFGRVDVVNIIEKAVLAVTLFNEVDEIIGHAAFYDYPNVQDVDQALWEPWLKSNFDEMKCSALNTLFLHMFVAKSEFSHGCAREIIRTAFTAVPDVHFLIVMVPNGIFPDSALAEIFKPISKLTEGAQMTNSTAFICHRHDHVPVLHVRHARVEDNDDLAPIFNSQSETLKSMYGDFFLAELIEAQDNDMKCLVYESGGRACGFACLNTNVNCDLLNECFELAPFNGLHKRSKKDEISLHQTGEVTEDNTVDEGEFNGRSHTILPENTLYTMSGQNTPKPLFDAVDRLVPTYNGLPNAFTIQLFCIDEKYEMRSMDFLPKAFSLYPELDFCVITVPHLVPEFPLLQGFVRATPRCPSILSQELYIFHKSGLLKNLRVRPIRGKDLTAVENMVNSLECHTNLLKDIEQFYSAKRDQEGREMQVFVAECLDQIVGVCVIKSEEEIEYIRSHYHVEDFIYFNHHQREEHGHIIHFALNPIFSHLSKHFLKEILRLGHMSCLYYPLYPIHAEKEVKMKHTMICSLKDLVPIRARHQILYSVKELGENAPSERVLRQNIDFALTHINRKLTLEPKVTVNARIVVIGASDVGVAFLETLAYCPHLRFNNVSLISPHGLPTEVDGKLLNQQFLSSSHPKSQDEKVWSLLHTWINVVYGKMTGIDREKKHLIVDNKSIVPYDHLLLCVGQQYQIPCPTEACLSQGITHKELTCSPDRQFTGKKPGNLYLINDNYDCALFLHKLQSTYCHRKGNIIIYGNSLDTYTTVQSLMELGISGSNIILVGTPASYDITCFNNETVEKTVYNTLKDKCVQVHKGYILSEWALHEDGNMKEVTFTSDDKPLKLTCEVFLSFYKKTVDTDALKAITDACLMYDGKLVVDAMFHTNDVSIRGAGTLTKYQRKYHADKWTHAKYNSREIGIALASEILKLFDPTVDQILISPDEQLNLIPVYRLPKIQSAILPGGYHYLHVKKPSLDVPLAVQMQNEDYGEELVTCCPGSDFDYFRLHINLYHSVETITCLSKKEIPSSNLICLYGLHEKCMNNLLSRFKEGLIQDFYSYFSESWCQALFHDRFLDLRDELRELLINSQDEGKETLENNIRQFIDEEMTFGPKQYDALHDIFKSRGSKKAVETRLLNFLSYNYYHLPMYAKPGMV